VGLRLGVAPIGLVVAGEVANYIGVRTYFVIFSIICVLPGFYVLASKKITPSTRIASLER
jgi:hypothetical protein